MLGHAISWADSLGWAAAGCTLAAFSMRTMLPLRLLAIASNLLFISYGIIGHLLPVLVLHCTLLPFNIWRLIEIRRPHQRDATSSSAG